MTVNEWLSGATQQLSTANIGTARLDALVLLGDTLNKNSAQLLAHPEAILSTEHILLLNSLLQRRITHEPLAYIRQRCEFYGRDFFVNNAVLVPRPETETMIDLLKSLPKTHQKSVLDVGTGSGAIAITVACELGEVQVIATDVDPACLKVARKNCVRLQATVDLIEADLINGLTIPTGTTVLANLPYVPQEHTINQAALHEPPRAIFGGADGLDLYRELFKQLSAARHSGYVLTESLPPQHTALTKIAKEQSYALQATDDFIQVFIKN